MYRFIAVVGKIMLEQCRPIVDTLRASGAVPVPMPKEAESLYRDLIVFGRLTEKDWLLDVQDDESPEFTEAELASGVIDFGLFRHNAPQADVSRLAGSYAQRKPDEAINIERIQLAAAVCTALVIPGKGVLAAVAIRPAVLEDPQGNLMLYSLNLACKRHGVALPAFYTLPEGAAEVQPADVSHLLKD